MQRKWSYMTFVIAVVTMLLLSACGGSGGASITNSSGSSSDPGVLDPNKKYTVNFWEAFATGANKAVLESLTKQYMQAHPNVTVNLQPYDSYDTLKTKITAAVAAGKPPTMAQVYESWATQYQQSDAIVSLQPFMTGKNGISDLSDFYPSLIKDGQIEGQQYMLPFNKSNEALYYNVNALQKAGISTPPTTLKEFADDLSKVTNGTSQWGMSITPSVDEWATFYKALGGGDFVSQDGKSAMFAADSNKQYATQAMDLLAPLAKSGAIHVTKSFAWQNDFISGKAVFGLATIASYPFLAQPIGTTFKFNEAPLPGGPAGQFTSLYGTNLAIFKGVDSDSQTAAWDYMKFLTSTESNVTFVEQTGYMPVRQSTFNSAQLQSYYTKTPARKVGPQQINNAFVPSTLPAWDQCRTILTTNFTSVLSGQLTAEAGVDKSSQQCTAALSQG